MSRAIRPEVCPADSGARDASGTPAAAAVAGGADRLRQIPWSRVAGPGQIWS